MRSSSRYTRLSLNCPYKRLTCISKILGDLDKSPEVSCVYHSEEAENQFMKDPKGSVMGDGQQYRNKAFR